jgi:hypothetical protein
MRSYAFLIYSSNKNNSENSYEYGFSTHSFKIVGDKPFSRGDIVEILSHNQESRNQYRINVRVLGDPAINSRVSSNEPRIEIPTLLFLSSRIYLSEFSSFQIERAINAKILAFEGVKQDQSKIYAVAALVSGAEANIKCMDPNSGVKFEWTISDRDFSRRRIA